MPHPRATVPRAAVAATLALVCWLAPTPAATGAASVAACAGADLPAAHADDGAVDAALLCLANAVRAAHRLGPLHANRYLTAVAGTKAWQMVRMDYFADNGPGGSTPLALVDGTRYPVHAAGVAVGQDIAWGSGPYATPRRILAAWMASAPHRAILLTGAYRDAGVAFADTLPAVLGQGSVGATYVMELGVRRR